jgi:phosphotransferase system enzyme I (PtsI)
MISSVEELRTANAMVDEIREELLSEGALLEPVARGAMIEVPAAVAMARELAAECDFLSIGSNDLIQYTLAVDRGNEYVAHLYDPFHPAVVRNIGATVQAAREMGVEVSSCGEMSGDIYGAALLLGLGCDTLSMSVTQLAQIKDLIRRVRMSDLRTMAEVLLREPTAEGIRRIMAETLVPILGEDAPMPVQRPLGRLR